MEVMGDTRVARRWRARSARLGHHEKRTEIAMKKKHRGPRREANHSANREEISKIYSTDAPPPRGAAFGKVVTVVEAAVWYAEQLGWSIIPVNRVDKKPLVRWKRYQTERASVTTIRNWFRRWPDANIAVVLGAVSGNLACRDFDVSNGYAEFCRRFPQFAATLPTVQTARGFHLYFFGATETQVFADGELRGEGGYCILPPSVHESGLTYVWLAFETIPTIDPSILAVEFAPATEGTEITKRSERTEDILTTSGHSVDSVHSVAPTGQTGASTRRPQTLEQAIVWTLPSGPGQRHSCIFTFCRALKALPAYANADADNLLDVFKDWYRRAEPCIRTKDFLESWSDFADGWERVQLPLGETCMTEVLARARLRIAPAKVLLFESDGLTLLCNLCAELQAQANGPAFYLSTRKAGEMIGVDHTTASRYLRILRRLKLLVVVTQGTLGPRGKATRWRYAEPAINAEIDEVLSITGRC